MSAPSVSIRPAIDADRDGIWRLASGFSTSFDPERPAFDQVFSRVLERDDMLLLVAGDRDDVLGYLLASCHETFLSNGPVGWVEEVMVADIARRQGIGGTLMETAEKWARTAGAAYVALASRRAAPFYAALGYEDSAVFFKKTLSR